MIIALIHWRIKPGKDSVQKFLNFWQERATVADRRGLVGEFLSEVGTQSEFPYITWDLGQEHPDFKPYVNVGIWASGDEFHEQIGQYFNDTKPLLEFEMHRRTRTILTPASWRIGTAKLPDFSHPSNVK